MLIAVDVETRKPVAFEITDERVVDHEIAESLLERRSPSCNDFSLFTLNLRYNLNPDVVICSLRVGMLTGSPMSDQIGLILYNNINGSGLFLWGIG